MEMGGASTSPYSHTEAQLGVILRATCPGVFTESLEEVSECHNCKTNTDQHTFVCFLLSVCFLFGLNTVFQ